MSDDFQAILDLTDEIDTWVKAVDQGKINPEPAVYIKTRDKK